MVNAFVERWRERVVFLRSIVWSRRSMAIALTMCVWLVFGIAVGHAQLQPDTDPFGGASGVPSAADPTDGVTDPTEEDSGNTAPAVETDPVVRAVLEMEVKTPAQLMHAVEALVNLNRPDLAKKYLKQILDANPTDQKLILLQRRFGSPLFVELARDDELQPEGAAVSAAVLQAADQSRRDATRLTDLVTQLGKADAAHQRKVMAELLRVGDPAVGPLVAVLADSERSDEYQAVGRVLVTLGDVAVPPLLASLGTSDSGLKRKLITILGKIKSKSAVLYLLGPAFAKDADGSDLAKAAKVAINEILGGLPTKAEAISFLDRKLETQLDLAIAEPGDELDAVDGWSWNETAKQAESRRMSPREVAMQAAAVMAESLFTIDPGQAEFRCLYLATQLEKEKRRIGLGEPIAKDPAPIMQSVGESDDAELDDILAIARERELEGTAIAVAEILGDRGDLQLLAGQAGSPREMTLALLSPYRRVRYAAAVAIMKMDPQSPYPGCSYLPNVLSNLAATAGQQSVLVGHPQTEAAQTLAGMLNGIGYAAETASTGQQLVLKATTSPDFVFAVISDRIDHRRQTELLQLLRRDNRTARLVVGLTYRDVNQDQVQRLADRDPLALAFPFPRTATDAAHDAARMMALARPRLVLLKEQIRHASFALDAMEKLAADSDRYGFYNILDKQPEIERAFASGLLFAKAARVLGCLGSATAQQALVNAASDGNRRLADRQAAAAAFREAVKRRNLMLTRDQIMKQYDRYNQSEDTDAETQKIFASILDVIEAGKNEVKPAQEQSDG